MKPILKRKNEFQPIGQFAALLIFLALIAFFVFDQEAHIAEKQIALQLDTTVSPPVCDQNGGFHTTPFFIKLHASVNSSIYYTIDGTEPSLTSERYKSPIPINDRTNERNDISDIPSSPRWRPVIGNVFKGTVIRAIGVTPDDRKSVEFISTFFVDAKGAKRYTLPVIALTVEKDDLFGYKNGIYVMGKNYEDKRDYINKKIPLAIPWWKYPSNYLKRGKNAGRPVHIEFYESSGQLAFEQQAEIRINGNATRGFSQKSLRISFDSKYGHTPLHYRLFPEKEVIDFNNFILRNAGNDWSKTFCRDAIIQSVAQTMNLDLQAYRPVIVFINGEYWGIHEIRDRLDENYVSNKYRIDSKDIVILELMNEVYYGAKSDADTFKQLLDFITHHSLADAKNYECVAKQIDIENFIDAIIANVYFCNSDWPSNNVRFWKYSLKRTTTDSVQSGKWRWMLYDTDWGLGYTGKEDYRLNLLEKIKVTGSLGIIFNGLLQNESFFNTFIQRFKHHLNTTFDENKVIEEINRFQSMLAPEMDDQINRWRNINSYSQWLANMEDLRIFAKRRPAIQLQQLDDFVTIYKMKH